MRKSTVIEGIAKTIVKQAWRTWYTNSVPGLEPERIDEQISRRFIETGSYEGIVKHISENQEVIQEFFIVSTEWGGVLQLMNSREYMAGFATLLSKLWAGEEHVARLVREVRYIRSGLYVTALLGMQEPWLYLNNWLFRQGLMRRVILIYQEPEDKKRWLPPLDLGRVARFEELRQIAEDLAAVMETYAERYPVEARFTSKAHELINAYAKAIEEELRQGAVGNWLLYYQNMWDHLVKLSVIHAASRQEEPRPAGTGYVIYVESSDVRAGIELIKRHLEKTKMAITLAGVPVKTAAMTVSQPVEETLLGLIERAGPRGLTTRELLRASKMRKAEVKEIVINLVEKGEVYAYVTGKSRVLYLVSEKHRAGFEATHPGARKIGSKTIEAMW